MTIGSNVNPNYPIPGLDQTSKGFRDNFATIKQEIEELQGTSIQLVGGIVSDPVTIGSSGALVLNTALSSAIIALNPPNLGIQYNQGGLLTGNSLFTFNPATNTIGIGTSTPNINTSIDAASAIHATTEITVTHPVAGLPAAINLNSSLGLAATFSATNSGAGVGAISGSQTNIIAGGSTVVNVQSNGAVGIGTVIPTVGLSLQTSSQDLGRFKALSPFADSVFRLSSTSSVGTIGYAVENRFADALGGISINSLGTVNIHSGESMDAYLSSSTARISINRQGQVGIGSYQPVFNLDVNGTFRSSGITDTSTPTQRNIGINNNLPVHTLDIVGDVGLTGSTVHTLTALTVDNVTLAIDTWPTSVYRSAKYLVEVVYGTTPSERVDVIDCIVTHANGTPYISVINSLSTNGPLGAGGNNGLTVQITLGYLSLNYTGSLTGNRVKVQKAYINY